MGTSFNPGPRYGTAMTPEEWNEAIEQMEENERQRLVREDLERQERVANQSAGNEPVPEQEPGPQAFDPSQYEANVRAGVHSSAANAPVSPFQGQPPAVHLSPVLVRQIQTAMLAAGAGVFIGIVIALIIRNQQKLEGGESTE